MKKCCDICGDIGVGGALISCSRCRSSSEHKYCMRTPLKKHPDDWICEDCESSSKLMSAESSSTKDLPNLANLDYCMEDCNGADLLAYGKKWLNDTREVSIDWEEMVPTGMTRYIGVEEATTVSSGAVKSLPPSKVTSNLNIQQPEIEVNFSSEQDLDTGPFQQLNTRTLGTMEIPEQQQSQSEKLTDMPPEQFEDQPVPNVDPSSAEDSPEAPTQNQRWERRLKNHSDKLHRYMEEEGKIPVIFRKKDGHPVGKYATVFMTELGVAVRKHAPLQVSGWKKITEEQKRPIFDQLKSSFIVDLGRGPSSVRKETDNLMSTWYRNSRVYMHKHYKTLTKLPWEERLKHVPKEYCNNKEDWEFMCIMFESEDFKKKSLASSKNRAKLLHSYRGGRKSLVQYSYDGGNVSQQKDRMKKPRAKKQIDDDSQSMDVADRVCDEIPGERSGDVHGHGNGPIPAKANSYDATSCGATNSGLRDELASTQSELHSTRTALESAEDKIRMLENHQKRLEEIVQANKQIGETNQRMMMQVFERIAPNLIQLLTQQPSSSAPPPSSV